MQSKCISCAMENLPLVAHRERERIRRKKHFTTFNGLNVSSSITQGVNVDDENYYLINVIMKILRLECVKTFSALFFFSRRGNLKHDSLRVKKSKDAK